MDILTFQFAVFFSAAALIYYVVPGKLKNLVLLASSAYFFIGGSSPIAISFMGLSIFINFYSGIVINAEESALRKRINLILAILFNISPLVIYKLIDGGYEALFNPSMKSLYILGLSYVTFSQISYIVDVYKKKISPEKSIIAYSVFVLFFPKITAGPIERASGFLGQVKQSHKFRPETVTSGLKLMLWGAFKKVAVSGLLAFFADSAFGSITSSTGFALLTGLVFFAFQIYYDFSGYTDIAIGAAQVFGFRLSQNFSMPYLSTSVSEFWRRWHMTLSFWVRDYIYIPMGGSRVSFLVTCSNLAVAFGIIGLWHGFLPKYIAWGLLNALFIILALITVKERSRIASFLGLSTKPALSSAISIILTFSMICITWVFFRAESVAQAFEFLKGLFLGWGPTRHFQFGIVPLAVALMAIAFTESVHLMQHKNSSLFSSKPAWVRWPVYAAAIWIIFMISLGDGGSFIYQRF